MDRLALAIATASTELYQASVLAARKNSVLWLWHFIITIVVLLAPKPRQASK